MGVACAILSARQCGCNTDSASVNFGDLPVLTESKAESTQDGIVPRTSALVSVSEEVSVASVILLAHQVHIVFMWIQCVYDDISKRVRYCK